MRPRAGAALAFACAALLLVPSVAAAKRPMASWLTASKLQQLHNAGATGMAVGEERLNIECPGVQGAGVSAAGCIVAPGGLHGELHLRLGRNPVRRHRAPLREQHRRRGRDAGRHDDDRGRRHRVAHDLRRGGARQRLGADPDRPGGRREVGRHPGDPGRGRPERRLQRLRRRHAGPALRPRLRRRRRAGQARGRRLHQLARRRLRLGRLRRAGRLRLRGDRPPPARPWATSRT